MDLHWVLLLPCILLQHITYCSETVVQINTKKWIYYVPERFLSITVDPIALAAASPLTQESYNMAKGLSPSFVRIGGIGTNALYFGKKLGENSCTVTETQWDSVNEFAKQTGLDIIASLNPTIQMQGVWDSQNSLELISYSNKKQYNVAWQLGYDVRGRNVSGGEIGRDLVRLRNILDGFQNYANLPVFGPDVTSVSGAKQIRFIKDVLTNAGNPLGAVILEPKFTNDLQKEDPHELMSSMTSELDTYVWHKEARLGKSIPKKPVWIAEPKASQGSFVDAVKLAKRVGSAARLGVQLYLRQAGVNTLRSPTPDFWFSLLYKTLVGQGVLDYKIEARNDSNLHVFSHCAAAIPQDKSVLDSDWKYEKGAVTVFGVNESPRPTKLSLKATNKEEPLHVYILTGDRQNKSPEQIPGTLLNGQALALSPSWDLPVLSPKVKKASKSSTVTIPGESIFFVVMPESKVRTCSIPPLSAPDFSLSELTKRLRLSPQKKSEIEEVEPEEDSSAEGVYVSFAKKKQQVPENMNVVGKTLMKTLISKLAPKKVDVKIEPIDKEEMPIRYITFNENSFLNKLAEGVKEELKDDSAEGKEDPLVKYPALTAAVKSSKQDVISIEPINPAKPAEQEGVVDHSRKRRASSEESPAESIEPSTNSDQMEMTEQISENDKKGSVAAGVIKNVSNLSEVSFAPSSDVEEDIDRSARHAEGMVVLKEEGDQNQDGKTEAMSKKEEEKEFQARTSELVDIIKETEKQSKVADQPGGIVLPPDTPEKSIVDIMVKTVKDKSDPEPGSGPQVSKLPDVNPALPNIAETPQVISQSSQLNNVVPALQPVLVPIQVTQSTDDSQQATKEGGVSKTVPQSVPIAMNPMLVPDPRLGEMSGIIKPNIQVMPAPNVPQSNQIPTIVTSAAGGNPPPPVYNVQKENAIDTIIKTMVEKGDEKLAALTNEETKQEEVKINSGSGKVQPVEVAGETILMSPEDVESVRAKNHPAEEIQTLASAKTDLELPVEDMQQSVKVARQAISKISSVATPNPQTATLAAPAVALESATTPPIVTPKSKPQSLNQVTAIKAPTPEELRERFKVLREKMLELRSQYLEARDKRLDEFKKQVVVAKIPTTGPIPDPETIKSTIKRRETELKEWFKRFDKREADAIVVPLEDETTKSRPRRLSLFTNDEGLDMEKFFEDEPAESYNYKRSPVIDGPLKYQYLSQGTRQVQDNTPRNDEGGNYLVSPDAQKHGIVINNRVYPIKLFGYVGKPDESAERGDSRIEQPSNLSPKETYDEADYGKYDDEPVSRYDPARSRIAFVPKDTFIKQIKSEFIPVVIIPTDDTETTPGSKRSKRSTLTDLEEKFHQVKDELFPKITSFIKNLSENPPWKRDLERSSRTRRSIDDLLRTNDLIHLKMLTGLRPKKPELNTAEIEDFVLNNLDKGENVLFTTAKKISNVASNIKELTEMGDPLTQSDPSDLNSAKVGYCEEIGTSGKSQIRDPFQDSSNQAQTVDKSEDEQTDTTTDNPDSSNSGEEMEESIILSMLTDKVKSALEKLKTLLGSGYLP